MKKSSVFGLLLAGAAIVAFYNYHCTAVTRIDASSSHSQRHILYNAFIANLSRFN